MNLQQQIAEKQRLGELICSRLSVEIVKLGFSLSEISHSPHYTKANFELVKDPYTGESNLTGYWHSERDKQRLGRLQFNSDGSFYAEFDVVKQHPSKRKYFVESVIAWGKDQTIKAEAKLLALPENS
jgi:hypothetical protein